MPRLAELKQDSLTIIALSLGGSVVRPQRLDTEATQHFIDFCARQTKQGNAVIAVIGGGGRARDDIEDARALGVSHEPTLDQIGILVTRHNALLLEKILEVHDLHVHIHKKGDLLHEGIIYLRGGTEPGHTTDYVAVESAHEAKQTILLNISTIKGLHPVVDGQMNKGKLIEKLTWDDYLAMSPSSHTPGLHWPFDPEAAKLARECSMTVILVGPDFDNIQKLLHGEDFIGTVIHP